MDEWSEDRLREDLGEIAEQLRAHSHEPTAVRLDELKRRAVAQSTRAASPRRGKGSPMRSRVVALVLVLGLALSGGAAGVIAGGGGKSLKSASKSQYKCNSGNGNGPEPGPSPNNSQGNPGPEFSPDCDPGNSPTHNRDNEREGPP